MTLAELQAELTLRQQRMAALLEGLDVEISHFKAIIQSLQTNKITLPKGVGE